jgi:hypothetical protein
MRKVNSPDVPVDHYAIIVFDTIYIPGDERSRTNPGHGYPESTENRANYYVTTNKAEWEAEIIRYQNFKINFLAITAKKAEIKTTITIN